MVSTAEFREIVASRAEARALDDRTLGLANALSLSRSTAAGGEQRRVSALLSDEEIGALQRARVAALSFAEPAGRGHHGIERSMAGS